MPSADAYHLSKITSDLALLALLLTCIACTALVIILWRRVRWVPRASGILARFGIPLVTFPVNPLLAVFQAALNFPLGTFGAVNDFVEEQNRREPLVTPATARYALIAILVLALALRLPKLGENLWYDEAFTARLTTLSLPQLPAAILDDVHPPLYYGLIWLWSRVVGSDTSYSIPLADPSCDLNLSCPSVQVASDFLLRIPSLVFGLLGILLLYRLAKAAGVGETTAVAAAGLMAVLPAAIYYSAELRAYSLLTCAVLGALICILEDRPRGFVAAVALVAWSHNLGMVYAGVLCLAALVYQWWALPFPLLPNPKEHGLKIFFRELLFTRFPDWLGCTVIAATLASLWLPFAVQQSQTVANGYWIQWDIGQVAQVFVLPLMSLPEGYVAPVLLPWFALYPLSWWIARRWLKTAPARLLAAVVLTVPALVALASMLWHPVFIARAFLPLALILLIPLAYSFTHPMGAILTPSKWMTSMLVTTVLIAALAIFYSPYNPRPGYQAAIAEGCQGADALYYTSIHTAFVASRYWNKPAAIAPFAHDNGDTFTIDEVGDFGFPVADWSALKGKHVCLLLVETPLTSADETAFYARTVGDLPPSSIVIVNRLQWLKFWIVTA